MNEFEITKALEEAKAAYQQARANDEPYSVVVELAAKVKSLNGKLQELLTEGAVDDPDGLRPIAIHQPTYYEIGAVNAKDEAGFHIRAKGRTREEAIYNWNNKVYFQKDGVSATIS